MAKKLAAENIPADVNQVIDQLERHCLAPDGSLISISTYDDLQNARDQMFKERQRYLEAMAVYLEAVAMVEEYQQAVSMVNFGVMLDIQGFNPQVCETLETLEHRMVVAEAAQKSRLPLISKDGDIREEEIEKWSFVSRSSLDSTRTSFTMSSSTNSTNYLANNSLAVGVADVSDSDVGGSPNRFLGIIPTYLWKTQLKRSPLHMDTKEYQELLADEIGSRLDAKCDKLADTLIICDLDFSATHHILNSSLPERVKLIIEEIEREESEWREDLYSIDRKFAECYSVIEHIIEVLIKLVRDIKQSHRHKYRELQKTMLCKKCEAMSAKIRVLEHNLLYDTYTTQTIPALQKIRKYLIEATEEASFIHNKAVNRLREYQSLDPSFESIAREYHDIVKKLEYLRWTIEEVEMGLKHMPDHPNS